MKKLICFILLFIVTISLYATTYTIETSKGMQSIVVPEGMSEKDVLLIIAKNYYEQSWDLEDTLAQLNTLKGSINTYIEENQVLREENNKLLEVQQKLIEDYKDLTKQLEKKQKLNWYKCYLGFVGDFNSKLKFQNAGLDIGVELFDKVIIHSAFSYPWKISFGLALTF